MELEDLRNELKEEAENIQDSMSEMEDLVDSVGGQASDGIRRSIHHLQEALNEVNGTIERLDLATENKEEDHG